MSYAQLRREPPGGALTQQKFQRYLFRRPMRIPPGVPSHRRAVRFPNPLTGGPLGPLWDGAWYLGAGGNGLAGLWIQQDASRKVVQRLAIKDVAMPIDPPWGIDDVWNNNAMWTRNRIGVELTEVTCQRMLNQKEPNPALSNLVKLYDHYPIGPGTATVLGRGETPRYRVFMEGCFRGSLDDLIRKNIAGGDADLNEAPWRRIPEPFLWHLFEQLALACVELQGLRRPRGAPGHYGSRRDAYAVHADLKPGNIMLCDPDPAHFPEYTRAKVCDFGMTRISWRSEHPNPGVFRNTLPTPGFVPPEMYRGPNYNKPFPVNSHNRHYKITDKANVWGFGMIILAAMEINRAPRQINYRKVTRGHWNPQIGYVARTTYSQALVNLVKDCLRYSPDRRPTPTALLQRVRAEMGPHVQGMDTFRLPTNPTAAQRLHEQQNRPCAKPDDLFPIGSNVTNALGRHATPKS